MPTSAIRSVTMMFTYLPPVFAVAWADYPLRGKEYTVSALFLFSADAVNPPWLVEKIFPVESGSHANQGPFCIKGVDVGNIIDAAPIIGDL